MNKRNPKKEIIFCPECGSEDLSLAGGWKSHLPGQLYRCRNCGNEVSPLSGDEEFYAEYKRSLEKKVKRR